MKKQIKKGLKWSLFLLSSAVFASPLAIPHNSSQLYPTVTKGSIGVGSDNGQLQDIVLVYKNIPNSYHTSPINLRAYLSYFYNYGDYNPKLVVYIAGGQGGSVIFEGAASFIGGTGGITKFTVPLANFIKKFGNNVSFYYVVGGAGGESPYNGGADSGGGGGASMVAVNNWPHDGGTTLAIAGGGGGAAGLANYSGNTQLGNGGGGGGGNDPGGNGQNNWWGGNGGLGGGNGYGGDNPLNQIFGGIANPNLIDICGGGGGGFGISQQSGPGGGGGGGTGGPGQNGEAQPVAFNTYIYSAFGGGGYYPGGNGGLGGPYTQGYNGGPGIVPGGYGGGGAGVLGDSAGGGGGYGGGGGGDGSAGGGGGGYCLDANHSPANNPSLGAELGSSCQAIDWENPYDGVYGNYGNGFVYIYIKP